MHQDKNGAVRGAQLFFFACSDSWLAAVAFERLRGKRCGGSQPGHDQAFSWTHTRVASSFVARGAVGLSMRLWLALAWVGKEPPANSDNCGNGNVPSRITRDRTANEANDPADDDTYQEPREPHEAVGQRRLRWVRCWHYVRQWVLTSRILPGRQVADITVRYPFVSVG